MRKSQKNKDSKYLILELLKSQQHYISGEDLAQRLKITRQALWKHIAQLEKHGYEILAVPHRGYQLISIPDKLYPWEIQYKLNTQFIGKEIHHHEVVNSTQDILWELGLENFPEGTIVVSEKQRKGRGRLKRYWISGQGGIYSSLLLKPHFMSLTQVPQIALLVSLGCIYGIKKATNAKCVLKWPNDILLNGKKLGGILCEVNAEADRINFVIVGIGINVNTQKRYFPSGATSLVLETARKTQRAELLKKILEETENLYLLLEKKGFSPIRTQWEKLCSLWGSRIKVKVFTKEIEGQAIGIDEAGCLILKKDAGGVETISAGDVVKLE
ncbi:MAG: biotin--[acetyl-CoA-carboxylase] ligase [Candidatus Omnitrophota bacterium]|nr:MAG: biotin--[acetyl-CoA-carboxylase] ligase [Candidatus Omnitrophota bacterium]